MPLVCFLRKKYLCLLWHRRRVNSESTRILSLKPLEALASPLPEDMASCFNATYHKPSLAETSEVKDLFSTMLCPVNIDMVVRTTNNGLFSLKVPAMPIIRSRDAKLQETQGSSVKSSYVTMTMAEDLAQAQARDDLPPPPPPSCMMSCLTIVCMLSR